MESATVQTIAQIVSGGGTLALAYVVLQELREFRQAYIKIVEVLTEIRTDQRKGVRHEERESGTDRRLGDRSEVA